MATTVAFFVAEENAMQEHVQTAPAFGEKQAAAYWALALWEAGKFDGQPILES